MTAPSPPWKDWGLDVIGALVKQLDVSHPPDRFMLCLEALANALVTLPDPRVLSKHPPWIAFAAAARTSLAPRLTVMLHLTIEEWDSAEQLAHKEAAVELVRCLRLESCYADMIGAASDERMCESFCSPPPTSGPRWNRTSPLPCRTPTAPSESLRAARWRPCHSNPGEGRRVLVDGRRRQHPGGRGGRPRPAAPFR